MTVTCQGIQLLHGFWELNTGPHAFVASTLLTELPPRPSFFFFETLSQS